MYEQLHVLISNFLVKTRGLVQNTYKRKVLNFLYLSFKFRANSLLPAAAAPVHAAITAFTQAWQAMGPDPAPVIELMSKMIISRRLLFIFVE